MIIKIEHRKKKRYLGNRPIIETRIAKSEYKNRIIHQTIITNIKPIGYLKKVLEDS